MDTLSRGTVSDPEPEILELVKQTAAPATALQAAIATAAETYESEVVKAHIQLLAAQLAGYDSHIREISETLAPYLSDPAVKKTLHDSLKIYNAHITYLGQCANFETGLGAEAITATIIELKGALNGLAVRAVGAELEPKVETPLLPPVEQLDETERAIQDELESATKAIRELSETLRETQQLRRQTVRFTSQDPVQLEKDMINEEVGEGILDATKAIAFASEKMMLTAIGLQKELVIAGRASKASNQYKKDPAWAQGLISASQSVTFTIRQLVVAAQGASRGEFDEERLQVLASNVNAAAIRLVTAAKVKATTSSQFAAQLSEVTKAVTAATSLLVEKSKKPVTPSPNFIERQTAEMSMTNRAIREIEVQTRILKLQKALEEAQVELGNIRKEEYAGSVAPVSTQRTNPRKGSTPQEAPEPLARKTSNAASQPASISTENGGRWPSLRKTSSPAPALSSPSSSSPSSNSPSSTSPVAASPVASADDLPPPSETLPEPLDESLPATLPDESLPATLPDESLPATLPIAPADGANPEVSTKLEQLDVTSDAEPLPPPTVVVESQEDLQPVEGAN